MITTTKGMMDEATLRHRQEIVDNDHEYTVADEYYDGDELVHRSVHVTLKRGLGIEAAMAQLG